MFRTIVLAVIVGYLIARFIWEADVDHLISLGYLILKLILKFIKWVVLLGLIIVVIWGIIHHYTVALIIIGCLLVSTILTLGVYYLNEFLKKKKYNKYLKKGGKKTYDERDKTREKSYKRILRFLISIPLLILLIMLLVLLFA